MKPFVNEPPLELRRASVRHELADALSELDRRLPLDVPVWVGDEASARGEVVSTDPGAPERVVAVAGRATEADVDEAVTSAARAQAGWGELAAGERAAILIEAATRLRERRLELAALEVRECAKPWVEADADVCEAIDFLEYYARQAVALEAGPTLHQPPGEHNSMRYVPRGVVGVISPWNFPLAIPAGMVSAALAVGNAALLKPAEQSPGCALALVGALREAGVPPAVVGLLPGEGEAGAALVRHAQVHAIAFTGSGAVGLKIIATAARVAPGQRHLKHVIAEMGGKNCILVDADADLDEAVPGIVASAFGYAGQKCSAASRVLVHQEVADDLLERLAGAASVLELGQAEALATDVPPVIEQAARERIDGYIARGRAEGRVVASRDEVPAGGWFCAPTVVTDLPGDSPVLHEEVFGPLVAVESVEDMAAGCELVEALPFALTGGLFSRNPVTVREVAKRTPVGNLYVNRATTGAVVGRQPFGGNRLSGTGSKAGGPDYLMEFVESRVTSENTVRHGLVV